MEDTILTDKVLSGVQETLSKYYGVVLNFDQIWNLLASDQSILKEITQFGIDDTYTREYLGDTLTDYLNVPPWPTYGDAFQDSKLYEYWKLFVERALLAGYKVTPL